MSSQYQKNAPQKSPESQIRTTRIVSFITASVTCAILILFATGVIGLPGGPGPVAPTPGARTAVHVFDVGEGLAVLIDSGEYEIVIDAGYAKNGESFSKYISAFVDGDIELVIATHSHADHVGGLARIYADYQVSRTVYGDTGTSAQYKAFEKAAREEPDAGFGNDENETIIISDTVTLTTIDVIDDDRNTNNNSVISVLEVGSVRILITGDAEEKAEKLLAGLVGGVDVYLVGHHGSETSSSQAFLDEIRPRIAVISSQGPNKGTYDNPDLGVLRRLDAMGTDVYATYRSGTIVVTVEDGVVSLSCPKDERITPVNFDYFGFSFPARVILALKLSR